MSMKFSQVSSWKIPEGQVANVKQKDSDLPFDLLWDKIRYRYVSLGDSIAAGQRIRDNDASLVPDGCYAWQFGTAGVNSTTIQDGTYTDLIRDDIANVHGEYHVSATSFARSGDRVFDLMAKLKDTRSKEAIERAQLVTICIGANEILSCVSPENLGSYITAGDITSIHNGVVANLESLRNDDNAVSIRKLLETLNSINPNAKYVFTTVYNPYRYLYVNDDPIDGFFAPLLSFIPNWEIDVESAIGVNVPFVDLKIPIGETIKNGILGTPIFQQFFDRFNNVRYFAELYITELNNLLRSKIDEYKSVSSNFFIADAKTEFEKYPNRTESADVHYNDLVYVEFTDGLNAATVDWGAIWRAEYGTSVEGVTQFWMDLAWKHLHFNNAFPSTNAWDYVWFDINSFAVDVTNLIINRVLIGGTDAHPKALGQKALKDAFAPVIGNEFNRWGDAT